MIDNGSLIHISYSLNNDDNIHKNFQENERKVSTAIKHTDTMLSSI